MDELIDQYLKVVLLDPFVAISLGNLFISL